MRHRRHRPQYLGDLPKLTGERFHSAAEYAAIFFMVSTIMRDMRMILRRSTNGYDILQFLFLVVSIMVILLISKTMMIMIVMNIMLMMMLIMFMLEMMSSHAATADMLIMVMLSMMMS